MMDMVMIVYNQAIDEEVLELLEEVGIDEYSKWQRVLGKGEDSSLVSTHRCGPGRIWCWASSSRERGGFSS